MNGDEIVAPVAGYCEDKYDSLGNEEAFEYATTPALAAGAQCVGLEVVSEESLEQRCVTVTGTVRGVSQRIQARVASFTAQPLFPYEGLIGLHEVFLKGNGRIKSGVASNGRITAEGNVAQEGGCELGPGGSYQNGGKASACTSEKRRTPSEGEIVLSPVNPGNSFESTGSCPAEAVAKPTGNCDFRIVNGMRKIVGESYSTPYDEVSGNGPFREMRQRLETERILELQGNVSLTLGGGVYNFCSLIASGNSTITVAAGVKTEIFVGSPDCPSNTGILDFRGNFSSVSGSATALQVYVYGNKPVNIEDNAKTVATVYAPSSEVSLRGGVTFEGGIVGQSVKLQGNTSFTWREEDKTLKVGEAGAADAYYRTAWGECTPEGTTPQAGC
ncbi:MAG: DUF7305 domain-containing protein [Solirubrobacteraceae bacterium]